MTHYIRKDGFRIAINDIPDFELVQDYIDLEKIQEQYFKLCKKYSPDDTYEIDEAFRIIVEELGHRQIKCVAVKTMEVKS